MRTRNLEVLDGIIERAREVAPGLRIERGPIGLTVHMQWQEGENYDRTMNPLGVLLPPRFLYSEVANTVLMDVQDAMMHTLRGQVWPPVDTPDPARSPTPGQVMKVLDEMQPPGGTLPGVPKPRARISRRILTMAYVLDNHVVLSLRPLPLPAPFWRRN